MSILNELCIRGRKIMTDEKRSRIKELEEMLSYLVKDKMTLDEKLKSLADAHWTAWHAGYGDAMANKLMGGEENEQTRMWEKNCENKYKIDELLELLKETEE